MADQDQIEPALNQDDELDVEELEDVAGGNSNATIGDTVNYCPVTNYCSNP